MAVFFFEFWSGLIRFIPDSPGFTSDLAEFYSELIGLDGLGIRSGQNRHLMR
jgi:hypothetical protein